MAKKDTLRETIKRAYVAHGQTAAFQQAYGQFMVAWADAEAELYHVLKEYAKVEDGVARAIFSGARARTMIDYIRGIAHNVKLPADRQADLDHVFPQMVAINSMRDMLAHYASDSYSFADDNPLARIITNADRVSRYGNERIDAVSVETLKAMTHDLYGIANHLNQHWGPWRHGKPFRPWRENDPNDPPTRWLYKPAQPQADRRKPNPHTAVIPRPKRA